MKKNKTLVVLLSLAMIMTMFANSAFGSQTGGEVELQGKGKEIIELKAIDDSFAGGEEQTLDVIANDEVTWTEPEQAYYLKIVDILANPNNTATISADGKSIRYTPIPGVTPDQFKYKVRAFDSNDQAISNESVAWVSVAATPGNQAPVTIFGAYITDMNKPITIDLLVLCSDPEEDPLTIVSIITQPSNGTVTLNVENGTAYYVPNEDFVGTDQFSYTVSDGNAVTAGAVQIQMLEDPLAEYKALKPVLEHVTYYGQLDSGEHAWAAHWGWLNENGEDVEALVCKFTGTVIGENNFPTSFGPGRQRDMFTTIFTSANLVWTLKGPDGSQRTATAARTPIHEPDPTTGHLTVQKQLQGGGSDDARFEIAIIPVAAAYKLAQQEEPIYISVNEPWQGELEPGEYQIIEIDMPNGYYFEEITDQGFVSIAAGGEYTVTIVNSYEEPEPEPDMGTLVIRKQITGSSGYSRNARFLVAIEPYNEMAPMAAAVEIQTVYISVNEPWSGELEAGTYLLREVEMPSSRYSLVGISNEGIVVVSADETSEVIITNRYRAPSPPPDPDPEPGPPEEPIEPEQPVDPEEPPVEPEEPTNPEEPIEPEEPTGPEQPDPGTLPKTSGINTTLMLGSILTLSGLWLSKKRN